MSSLSNFIVTTSTNNQPQLPEGFEYTPQFLNKEEASNLYNELTNQIEWEEREITMFGKVYMQPRLIKWYGDRAYSYSKQNFQAQKMPTNIQELKKKIEQHSNSKFNSVLINWYRNEQDSMGKHSDDEKELGNQPTIASVSLGEEREFIIINRVTKKRTKVTLQHGSLLIMSGNSQHDYWHELPKSKHKKRGRVNLTYRYIY
ncbi:MAG: alpha-ketoglutarate-dependent dioxygenase AlkB family protein [Candidatus Nanoarchaeia archaeon]